MVRHVRRIAPLLLALAAAGVWLAPATEAKEPHPVVQLAKKLAEPVDFPGIDDPKATLQEVLEFLAQKNGVRFDINEKAFQAEMGGLAGVKAPRRGDPDLALVLADDKPAQPGKPGPADKPKPPSKAPAPPPAAANAGDIASTPVAEKPIPKMTHVRLSTVLKKILERVPSMSGATYVLRRDGIEITTEAAKTAEFRNPADHAPSIPEGVDPLTIPPTPLHLVQAEFDKRPLDEALKELADATDCTVVLDVREKEKAKTVTATLINVPLDTAVELLANMAGLQVVSRDRVLYVTTKENADAMAKELRRRVPPPPTPAPPGMPQPFPPGPGLPAPDPTKPVPPGAIKTRAGDAEHLAQLDRPRPSRSEPGQDK